MTEILDELSETVYIADTKTYELLFLNKAGQNFFSVNFDYRGRKCYQVLQNRDLPCPFCTNSKLTQRNVYQWEFFNPIVKRHYLLKDKLVQWGGRGLVRMEISLDVTDIKYPSTKNCVTYIIIAADIKPTNPLPIGMSCIPVITAIK